MEKNEDIIELILRKLESMNLLRKRMTESAADGYTGRYLFALITFLLLSRPVFYISINAKTCYLGSSFNRNRLGTLMESKRKRSKCRCND